MSCEHEWHEEEMRGFNSSKFFCAKCNLEIKHKSLYEYMRYCMEQAAKEDPENSKKWTFFEKFQKGNEWQHKNNYNNIVNKDTQND